MIWLLDNGHGGVRDGVYLTNSLHKKSPILPDGEVLYEGEWNRKVVAAVMNYCKQLKIEAINLVPEIEDIAIDKRAERVNSYSNAFVLSIHMNGTDEFFQSEKSGITTFYYRHNEGRKFAWVFQDFISEVIPNRGIFEKAFKLPLKSIHPCLLLECGFMNNINDVEYLRTKSGIEKLALHIVFAMQEIEKLLK